jgi:lipoic acid synthetase
MKPQWLNKKISLQACSDMKRFLRGSGVETVCEQAMCPNIGECFSRKQATFLILGKHCTRHCKFCNIDKGTPCAPDPQEPDKVAEAVSKLALRHVVITSVTRDDLSDGGAGMFAATVSSVRAKSAGTVIEVLIPDFKFSLSSIKAVADSVPDIIAHNVETVPALYCAVRQGAEYQRSLKVLAAIKRISPGIKTKSGIMLGLGENKEDILEVMRDLRSCDCDFLSIGQYLAPSGRHYPVKEYITPERFLEYKDEGRRLGFLHVESGPYVRSSYMAQDYLEA